MEKKRECTEFNDINREKSREKKSIDKINKKIRDLGKRRLSEENTLIRKEVLPRLYDFMKIIRKNVKQETMNF